MKPESSYQWQEECLSIWENNGYRGIVQAVTGAGKTILAVKAIKKLHQIYGSNLWTAIVVPTRALMLQWNRILLPLLLEEYTAEKPRFHVYVINSARYQLARQILGRLRDAACVFLIADECHHYASAENRKIFEFIPHMENAADRYFALGLSATVTDRYSAEILEPALGRIIFHYSYNRALKEGVIAEFKLIQVALHFQKEEYSEYQKLSERMKILRKQLYSRYPLLKKDAGSFFPLLQTLAKEDSTEVGRLAKSFLYLSYQRKELVCMAKNRIFCVRDLLSEIDPRKKVLIFSERIGQAETLYRHLKYDYGSKVGKYHYKAGKQANANTLRRFRDGEILILIACKALDEGLDVPDAEIGIILSGTGIERQRMQRLGRILRKSDDKETACLYYLFIEESMEERNYVPLPRERFQVEERKYHLPES